MDRYVDGHRTPSRGAPSTSSQPSGDPLLVAALAASSQQASSARKVQPAHRRQEESRKENDQHSTAAAAEDNLSRRRSPPSRAPIISPLIVDPSAAGIPEEVRSLRLMVEELQRDAEREREQLLAVISEMREREEASRRAYDAVCKEVEELRQSAAMARIGGGYTAVDVERLKAALRSAQGALQKAQETADERGNELAAIAVDKVKLERSLGRAQSKATAVVAAAARDVEAAQRRVEAAEEECAKARRQWHASREAASALECELQDRRSEIAQLRAELSEARHALSMKEERIESRLNELNRSHTDTHDRELRDAVTRVNWFHGELLERLEHFADAVALKGLELLVAADAVAAHDKCRAVHELLLRQSSEVAQQCDCHLRALQLGDDRYKHQQSMVLDLLCDAEARERYDIDALAVIGAEALRIMAAYQQLREDHRQLLEKIDEMRRRDVDLAYSVLDSRACVVHAFQSKEWGELVSTGAIPDFLGRAMCSVVETVHRAALIAASVVAAPTREAPFDPRRRRELLLSPSRWTLPSPS